MKISQASTIYETYKKTDIIRDIAPDDVMFNSGRDWYFDVGESALNCILSALTYSRLETVGSVLDLPCGHGRVTRHLRAAFPVAELAVCDIDAAAIAFCAATFNARSIQSTPDLTRVNLTGTFDLIWIGSLFTHVDRVRTERWMRFLCQHLNRDGVLLASFHGSFARDVHLRHYPMIGAAEWARIEEQCASSGYGYEPYPGQDYGISFSRAATIVAMACDVPGTRVLSYTERGWAEHHDVIAIAKTDRAEDWQSASKRYPPSNCAARASEAKGTRTG
jgi:SAM-dependent methyltransferase